MSSERFLPAPRTPTRRGSGRHVRTLPSDLLEQSCRRVGIAALAAGAVWVIGVVMNVLYHRQAALRTMPLLSDAWPWPAAPIAGVGAASSLAMAWLAGRLHATPYRLLNVGLLYEVFTAFLIGLWNGASGQTAYPQGMSWMVLVILVYPAIAPSTPGRTMLAAFAAALMDPVGYALAAAWGVPIVGGASAVAWATVPNLIAASLAVIPAHIITSLGREVSAARELGSYRVGELVASGGMGEVYRATHRLLARPAAIKLVRPDVLGARSPDEGRVLVKRFQREAAAAAALRSPHTIELYDFGVGEDGTFYLVMELLDGLTLDQLVERFGPVPPERAVHLLRQACESLAEAHDRGLVHRDVKPSNLYTCRLARAVDFVKVLDFGLVKSITERGQERTKLTSPESLAGTPAFMAPELVLDQAAVDRRVDIYALGCVAYWLLSGRLVFEADNALAMLHKHLEQQPLPPSSASEVAIPPGLDAVVLACLAKRPEDRPADMDDLARRLAEVPIAEPWTAERAAQWWTAHQPAIAAGVTPDGDGLFADAPGSL